MGIIELTNEKAQCRPNSYGDSWSVWRDRCLNYGHIVKGAASHNFRALEYTQKRILNIFWEK